MNRLNPKSRNQVEALLALTQVHKLGARRIRLLLQIVDHPAEVFTLPVSELEQINGIGSVIAREIIAFDGWESVHQLLAATEEGEAEILTCYDTDYPPMLHEIYDSPILLWVKGDRSVLTHPGIAVVGTRRASGYGKKMAATFSAELAGAGFSIVSGLAYGIDAAAHRAAIEAAGITVAVLGSGIDTIYPFKHGKLAQDIVDSGGAVISEFPPGTAPDAGNFPQRNRIVSGLTLGTLVVESGLKGGSMITAQSALMQNREVFVIPHQNTSSNGVGCNHLIKRAAGKLVQSVEDIIEEIPEYHFRKEAGADGVNTEPYWREREPELDEESRSICRLLEESALHIDALSEATGTPGHRLLAKLLELEMQNCVRQRAGKKFELV